MRANLERSFPNYKKEQLDSIERKFYRHLSDVIVEMVKSLSISKRGLLNRVSFTPRFTQLFENYYQQKQGVIVVMGHMGNWEWSCLAFSAAFKQELDGLYHPLSNKAFDKLMIQLRGRFGAHLVDMHQFPRLLPSIRKRLTTLSFIADQTPSHQNAHWTNFLNQDTAVFLGTERIAKKLNWPVVYVSVSKTKRGCYEIDGYVLSERPQTMAEGVITELHTKALEKNIIDNPHLWLWSHRRWKRKRPQH